MTTFTTTSTTTQVATVEIEIYDQATMTQILNPFFECHSHEKLEEFVAWYRANTRVGQIAFIRGYAPNGQRVYVNAIIGKRY